MRVASVHMLRGPHSPSCLVEVHFFDSIVVFAFAIIKVYSRPPWKKKTTEKRDGRHRRRRHSQRWSMVTGLLTPFCSCVSSARFWFMYLGTPRSVRLWRLRVIKLRSLFSIHCRVCSSLLLFLFWLRFSSFPVRFDAGFVDFSRTHCWCCCWRSRVVG